MACEILFIRPVFFVRWAAPEVHDLPKVNLEFMRAFAEHGDVIPYIGIVPEDCKPPDDQARKAFVEGAEQLLDHCSSLHLVMEGSGFKHAIMRNVFAAMLMLGKKRGKVFVHRNLDEALEDANMRAPVRAKFSVANVRGKAQTAGIVTQANALPRARGRG